MDSGGAHKTRFAEAADPYAVHVACTCLHSNAGPLRSRVMPRLRTCPICAGLPCPLREFRVSIGHRSTFVLMLSDAYAARPQLFWVTWRHLCITREEVLGRHKAVCWGLLFYRESVRTLVQHLIGRRQAIDMLRGIWGQGCIRWCLEACWDD